MEQIWGVSDTKCGASPIWNANLGSPSCRSLAPFARCNPHCFFTVRFWAYNKLIKSILSPNLTRKNGWFYRGVWNTCQLVSACFTVFEKKVVKTLIGWHDKLRGICVQRREGFFFLSEKRNPPHLFNVCLNCILLSYECSMALRLSMLLLTIYLSGR